MNETDIRKYMCDICHKMWMLGWVAANDGNVSVKIDDNTFLVTPTGISKSLITEDKLIKINKDGEIIEALGDYKPSSEVKMHLKCYEKRSDVQAVIHAHPATATAFAVAHIPMDMYNIIECVSTLGSVPIAPYGTPSTSEVPDSIEPFLDEHDAILLENHGALTMGCDLLTAYYRMESLELWAKITLNAQLLGGSKDISRKNIDTLIELRKKYKITGRHPGYKKYNLK